MVTRLFQLQAKRLTLEPGDITILEEAKVLIEQWRREYNQVGPHSAKNYYTPAPKAILTATLT